MMAIQRNFLSAWFPTTCFFASFFIKEKEDPCTKNRIFRL